MDQRYKLPHILVTEGDQESGFYSGKLIEVESDTEVIFKPVEDNHKNGLQEMRRKCATYLRGRGYPVDYLIQHHCIKPGRSEKDNPVENWTLYDLEAKTNKDRSR
ncbi:hypothetical protein J23TS9_01640 [Paenibacillus sp. J23TS9]|uniref:hypothetical protein n=1 Tax=Paenibacillus sp. J23TS9 TaxID=2807193 RepID=UPI001B246FD2|nr:hypothetical protein [Paenibacillus sp. J23TS9]GIP25034.1 hypothetical protein J23TS9_01640 [Paenibacillus sp. J23TS9]